jgi:hypothetical protein
MKKSNQIILLGILFLIMLLAMGGYVYLYLQINKKTASAESIVAEIDNEKKSQQNIMGLKRSIELSEAKYAMLNSYFINEEKVVGFIEEIESLAQQASVTTEISSIQSGEQIGKKGLYVTLDAQGNFDDVNNFIVRLENMPYQIQLTNVLLSTQKGSSQKPTIDPKTGKAIVSTGVPQWKASLDFVLISYIKE